MSENKIITKEESVKKETTNDSADIIITMDNGDTYTLNKDAMDDWELLEGFRAIDRGDMTAFVDIAPKLLGEKQFSELKERLRKDGKVKMSEMIVTVGEILTKAGTLKNS